jgi:hypothetical protein
MAVEVLFGFVELAIAHDCRRTTQSAAMHQYLNRIERSLPRVEGKWTAIRALLYVAPDLTLCFRARDPATCRYRWAGVESKTNARQSLATPHE